MVKVKEDLTGRVFGKLTVIKQVEDYVSPKGKRRAQWLCECSCDDRNQIITTGNSLKRNHTRSCGCLEKEAKIKNGKNNKRYNVYNLSGEYGIGYTFKGEEFWFDLEDYDKIKSHSWSINSKGYVVTNIRDSNGYKGVKMHRLIMDFPNTKSEIDHIHGKETRHDNRKSNLRIVTKSQNQMNKDIRSNNTSGVTGVCLNKDINKWYAFISINKKTIFLGYHDNFELAVKARKRAEEKYFGEFSYDNSINR